MQETKIYIAFMKSGSLTLSVLKTCYCCDKFVLNMFKHVQLLGNRYLLYSSNNFF